MKLLCVGKLKEKALVSLQKEYLKRLNGTVEVVEIKEGNPAFEPAKILKKEGELLLQQIKATDFVVVCALAGKSYDSVTLAHKVKQWQMQSQNIVVIIGGSYGLAPEIYQRSNVCLAFSLLTFPHQLFRIMVLEQWYRALMINSNRTYHK